jgi:hypothetical protein
MRSLTIEDLAVVHDVVSHTVIQPLSEATRAAHFELVDLGWLAQRAKPGSRVRVIVQEEIS